jgi:SAM-dependent methyltransferase
MHNHQQYYYNNKKYTAFLDSHSKDDYLKYVSVITLLAKLKLIRTKCETTFLDVGCGTGLALQEIDKCKWIKACGIEISNTSVEKGKEKKLNVSIYNGKHIPYKTNTFDIVGSYNVLEHTDDPIAFLDENVRVLKPGGLLIVATPNFLAVSNNYHHSTKGILNKIKNLFSISLILITKKIHIPKMKPIVRENFYPDDDAVNKTNPLSILHWASSKNMKLVYWSSQLKKTDNTILRVLDKTICKIGLGASFQIFKKM